MASAFIVTRRLPDGGRRYQVRYRLGGRESVARYGGQFTTMREAQARRNFILGELAALRVPTFAVTLPAPAVTVQAAADAFIAAIRAAGRSESTVKTYEQAVARLGALAGKDVDAVTTADVQGWLNTVNRDLAPASARKYLDCLRMILDREDGTPNPARSRRLQLPSMPAKDLNPPSTREVAALLEQITPLHRDALVLLDWAGLRITELCSLRWGDLDRRNNRIRVAAARSKGGTRGRRFIPIPADVMAMLEARVPLEDRDLAGRIFPDATRHAFANALKRACKFAGTPVFSPHNLRDRFISLLMMASTPVVVIQQVAGHSRPSVTLDVYSHVLIDESPEYLAMRRSVVEGRGGGVTGGVTQDVAQRENPAIAGPSEPVAHTGFEPVLPA